jgi:adenine-specific DNA-methyltransferase
LFFSPRNEKWLWYVKNEHDYVFNLDDVRDPNVKYPNQKKNGKLKCNPLGKNSTDVWEIPKVTSGKDRSSAERTSHPAQFPLALVNRILRASSHAGDLLLDPFAGSGSLLEAAVMTGRKAIGFELNPEYVEIAINRLRRLRHDQAIEKQQSNLLKLAAE